jgi:arylsulfatase A-like enzyme
MSFRGRRVNSFRGTRVDIGLHASIALALLLLVACGAEPVAPRGPNVLVVTIDTIRADHTTPYGYSRDTTPALARLAADGVLFEDAYAPMATTGPSHASLFTSLYPLSLGYLNNFESLGEANLTLAEILHDHGYETAAVVSSTPVSAQSGLAQGFDHFDDEFSQGGEGKLRARETTDRAKRWLGRSSERPFFLWVHYFDPHAPYDPPLLHLARFAPLSTDRLAWTIAKYDADLRFTDDAMGELIEGLRELGHFEETLIVVTGDHGEGLMDHGFMTHGPLLHEEAVKVPLILHWPGRVPPGRLPGPVELRDLPRTILDLLGLPSPDSLQGHSLLPVMTGGEPADPDRRVFLQRRTYEQEDVHGILVRGEKFGVREGSWKYLEAAEEGTRELYDLSQDPSERINVVEAHPERARSLSEALRDLAGQRLAPTSAPQPWSDDDLKRLEDLGYVR